MKKRTGLIPGAGLGGLAAAQTLRKLLPTSDRAIAVDRVEFRHGDVTRIDPQRREVEAGGESLTADALC